MMLKAGSDPAHSAKDKSNPLSMVLEAKNSGTIALIKKALKAKGASKADQDKMMEGGATAKAEQDAQRAMAEMMQKPDFQVVMQQLMGKFGNDPAGATKMETLMKQKAQDLTKKNGAGVNPNDPDIMMKVMQELVAEAPAAGGQQEL